MTDLTALIQKLEAATGPSRELDAEIAVILKILPSWIESWPEGPLVHVPEKGIGEIYCSYDGDWERSCLHWPAERYTASLDAAVTLIPDGWAFNLLYEPQAAKGQEAVVWPIGKAMKKVSAPTLPLAVCIAALKARNTQ